MKILPASSPASISKAKSAKAPPLQVEAGVPDWVDRSVAQVPVRRNTAITTAMGVSAGVGVGLLCDQLALGGAIGAAAGLLGAVGVHLHQSRQREDRLTAVMLDHDAQRRTLQGELDVPRQPTASYTQAKVYANEKNLLVEFLANGAFLSVTNIGPKRSVVWVRESEAYGSAGEALGRVNQGIGETEINFHLPGKRDHRREIGDEVEHYGPMTELDQQVVLTADGKLNFAHSGNPGGGAVYDLENGNVDSPFLTLRQGKVENLSLPDDPSSYRRHLGFAYEGGQFRLVGGKARPLTPTVPLESLGFPVTLPTVKDANTPVVRTAFSIKNEGIFASARAEQTFAQNYVPPGADWVREPGERLQAERLDITFASGLTLAQNRSFEGDTLRGVVTEVLLDGKPWSGMEVTANAEGITINKAHGADPYRRRDEKTCGQSVYKDGTIVWSGDDGHFVREITFTPNGKVSGEYGPVGYEGRSPMPEHWLPELRPDGTLVLAGNENGRLFLAPSRIVAREARATPE